MLTGEQGSFELRATRNVESPALSRPLLFETARHGRDLCLQTKHEVTELCNTSKFCSWGWSRGFQQSKGQFCAHHPQVPVGWMYETFISTCLTPFLQFSTDVFTFSWCSVKYSYKTLLAVAAVLLFVCEYVSVHQESSLGGISRNGRGNSSTFLLMPFLFYFGSLHTDIASMWLNQVNQLSSDSQTYNSVCLYFAACSFLCFSAAKTWQSVWN